jgi:K+-sensing histidine kinase KdpD
MNERILLVDDEQNILDVLKVHFRKHFEVETALGPNEGLSKVQSDGPFAVVVSDLKMPSMDGLEFLYWVQRMEPDTVRIILTGHAELHTVLSAINSELAFRFIEKPYDVRKLLKAVQDGVSQYHKNVAARLESNAHKIICHDIKGPLLGITGLSSMMLKSEELSPYTAEMLESIRRSGLKTLKMLDSVRVVQQIESRSYSLKAEPLNVVHVIDDILMELSRVVKSKQLFFEISFRGNVGTEQAECIVHSDKFLVECVLGNILRNAVEASPYNGIVTIDVQRSDALYITIGNEGEVPKAIRGRFFEKYITCGKLHGTGLGTYSARLMTRAMDGEITLDTSIPGRTAIKMHFPMAQVENKFRIDRTPMP